MEGTVLLADDDQTIRTVLSQALHRAGCKVHATSSLTTLMRWIGEGRGDVVITDVMMPDGNGLEMLPKIAEDRPGLPVIVISAQNSIMTAIRAREAEAFDYLPKPFDLPELMKRTAQALAARRPGRVSETREENADLDALPLIGQAPVMQALYQMIARLLNTDLPVLISGEIGTGKTLIARAFHDFSDRRNQPFLRFNPVDLALGNGAERTMEEVRSGTVLIDGLGDIASEMQGRIVQMIDRQEGKGPQFIATCQGNATAALNDGRIRADLFYRLEVARLEVPPLRARLDDIGLLTDHFLSRSTNRGGAAPGFSPEAMALLRAYPWPGNVRQLENMIRRLTLASPVAQIDRSEVEIALEWPSESAQGRADATHEKLSESVARHLQRYFDLHGQLLPPAGLHQRILREIELPLIEIALDASGGNQAKCAELLGINRNTLRKKMNDLDISVARRRRMM